MLLTISTEKRSWRIVRYDTDACAQPCIHELQLCCITLQAHVVSCSTKHAFSCAGVCGTIASGQLHTSSARYLSSVNKLRNDFAKACPVYRQTSTCIGTSACAYTWCSYATSSLQVVIRLRRSAPVHKVMARLRQRTPMMPARE